MISESALAKFRASLRGQSFFSGEQGYDAARSVPNAMIDRRPTVIAHCAGAADVITCVRFAREHNMTSPSCSLSLALRYEDSAASGCRFFYATNQDAVVQRGEFRSHTCTPFVLKRFRVGLN
jgi:hypothetical protein